MIPPHWTFNDPAVAAGFDKHVREQLPWYDLVTDAIAQLGRHYISQGGTVYDIGAATGNIGLALTEVLHVRDAFLTSIEESPDMAAKWNAPGTLHIGPAQAFEYKPYDFAVSMLCLMFLRPGEVMALLDILVRNITTGGALVLVERMLPPGGYLSIVSSRLTLAAKLAAGATPDEIIAKELSLAGAQRPLDRRILERYSAVEWFRYGDFAGWIIEGSTQQWLP